MPDIKNVIKAMFPFINAAASLGGPLGTMAASAVAKVLGVDTKIENTPEAITAAINGATPEQLLALKKADQDFAVQMESMGYKNLETLEQLATSDRDSARKREMSIRDYTPETGFYLLVMVFAFFLRWLFKYPVPTDNKAIIYSALGSLGSLVIMAATYFYGSTRQSGRQTELLAQSQPPNGNSKS